MAITTIEILHPKRNAAIRLGGGRRILRRPDGPGTAGRDIRGDVRVELSADSPAHFGSETAPHVYASIDDKPLALVASAIHGDKLSVGFQLPSDIVVDTFHTLRVKTTTPPTLETVQELLVVRQTEKDLLRIGDDFFEKGRLKEAEFCWNGDHHKGSINRLVSLYLSANRIPEAVALCKSGGTVFTFGKVARHLARAGKHDEAIQLLDAGRVALGNAELLEMRGVVEARAHRHDLAITTWQQANTGRSQYYLALLQSVKGNHAASLVALKNALRLQPLLVERARGDRGEGDTRLGGLRTDASFRALIK